MPQTNSRTGPVVPPINTSNCKNIVLERALETAYGNAKHLHRTARKGGMIHSSENLQLELTTLDDNICKAYKRYAKLKKDSGRRDMWLQQLIEAQAKEQQTPKKHYGKSFVRRKGSEIMPA